VVRRELLAGVAEKLAATADRYGLAAAASSGGLATDPDAAAVAVQVREHKCVAQSWTKS
jgi:hypothetical protein